MSDRIETIASEIPSGIGSLYEVCCDHALITKKAFETGKISSAVVSDISGKCLLKAKENLKGFNAEYIECDGIDRSVDAGLIVICGVGGMLLARILKDYDGSSPLLLSPQLNPEEVRRTLAKKGYELKKDFCFEADGKYYDLMYAEKGSMALDVLQEKYGRFYRDINPALKEKLEKRLEKVKGSGDPNKINEIKEVLKWQILLK